MRTSLSVADSAPQSSPVRPPGLYSNAWDGFNLVGLKSGDDVLLSSRSLAGASTWNTAVWLVDGRRRRLLILDRPEDDKVWFTRDRRIARADSIREALALVAPAVDPDTDAIETPAPRSDEVPALGATVAAVIADRDVPPCDRSHHAPVRGLAE